MALQHLPAYHSQAYDEIRVIDRLIETAESLDDSSITPETTESLRTVEIRVRVDRTELISANISGD